MRTSESFIIARRSTVCLWLVISLTLFTLSWTNDVEANTEKIANITTLDSSDESHVEKETEKETEKVTEKVRDVKATETADVYSGIIDSSEVLTQTQVDTDTVQNKEQSVDSQSTHTAESLDASFILVTQTKQGTAETVQQPIETQTVVQSAEVDQSEESNVGEHAGTPVQSLSTSEVVEELQPSKLSPIIQPDTTETEATTLPVASLEIVEGQGDPHQLDDQIPLDEGKVLVEPGQGVGGMIEVNGIDTKGEEQPKKEEEQLVELTFHEWTQKVLAEEEKGKMYDDSIEMAIPSQKQQKKRRKNYAQRDCGAKILATNPEAVNSPSILNNNKDDYMINPCSAKKWFVLELCEPIQAHSVEIASLELFSSQPKAFKLSLSDRYPCKEWKSAGTYVLSEERVVQTFQVTEANDYFAKYVRVELTGHYGSEHFCPLTLLRINGMGVVDYDEPEEDGEENYLENPDVPSDGEDTGESNLFTSAKNTVLKIVKKVLNVDVGTEATDSKNGTEVVNDLTEEVNLPSNTSDKPNISLPCVPEVGTTGSDGDSSAATQTGSDGDSTAATQTGTAMPELPKITTLPVQGSPEESIVIKLKDDEQMPSEPLPDGPIVTHIGHEDESQDAYLPYERFQKCFSCDQTGPKRTSCSPPSSYCLYRYLILRHDTDRICNAASFSSSQYTDFTKSSVVSKLCKSVSSDSSSKIVDKNVDIGTTEGQRISDQSLSDIGTTESQRTPDQSMSDIGTTESQRTPDQSLSDTIVKSNLVSDTDGKQVTDTASLHEEREISKTKELEPDIVQTETVPHIATQTTIPPTTLSSKMSESPVRSTASEEPAPIVVGQVGKEKTSDTIEKTNCVSGTADLEPSPSSTGEHGTTATVDVMETREATPSLPSVNTNWKPDTNDLMSTYHETDHSDIQPTDSSIHPSASNTDGVLETPGTVEVNIEDNSYPNGQLDMPEVDPADQKAGGANGGSAEENKTSEGTERLNKEPPLDIVRLPVNIPINKRESAIMRLNNRVKLLEHNVSLSSRFLEELSRRYKKQTEDIMKMLNKTVAKLNNVTLEATTMDKIHEEQISVLDQRLRNMTAMVNKLNKNLTSLNKEVTDRQMIWTAIEIVALFIILIVFSRRGKSPELSQEMKELIKSMPSTPGRQPLFRRNSLSGPATPSKRKQTPSPGVLQRWNSETALDDCPVILPSALLSALPAQRDVNRKKKKKKNKHLDSKLAVGLIGENLPDTQTGSRHNSFAGILFKTTPDDNHMRTSPSASASVHTMAKSSPTNSVFMSLNSSKSSTGPLISSSASSGPKTGGGFSVVKRPQKPPSPATTNRKGKVSPNANENSKPYVKGHKRVTSLPKIETTSSVGLMPPRTGQGSNIEGSFKMTSTNSKMALATHSSQGNQHLKKTVKSGSFDGKIPSNSFDGKSGSNSIDRPVGRQESKSSDKAAALPHVPKGKRHIPQCGVQALYYGIEEVPFNKVYSPGGGANSPAYMNGHEPAATNHSHPSQNGFHHMSNTAESLGENLRFSDVRQHGSLNGHDLDLEGKATASRDVAHRQVTAEGQAHSPASSWKKFTSLFKS